MSAVHCVNNCRASLQEMSSSTSARTVLITGGTSGIGQSLAQQYLSLGSTVYVTSRRSSFETKASSKIHTLTSDAASPTAREALAKYAHQHLPDLDAVVLNAGIQLRIPVAEASDHAWAEHQIEIDTLLAGPIHLSSLLIPILLAHGRPSQIIVVTSGLGILPAPPTPVYSACKAGLRSYVHTLRHALRGTNISVSELIPPRVKTSLGGADGGVELNDFVSSVFPRLQEGHEEVGYGMTEGDAMRRLREGQRDLFEQRANGMKVPTFADRRERG